jgi:outer membrane protein OmpA-like peptidoglycan-associated protein
MRNHCFPLVALFAAVAAAPAGAQVSFDPRALDTLQHTDGAAPNRTPETQTPEPEHPPAAQPARPRPHAASRPKPHDRTPARSEPARSEPSGPVAPAQNGEQATGNAAAAAQTAAQPSAPAVRLPSAPPPAPVLPPPIVVPTRPSPPPPPPAVAADAAGAATGIPDGKRITFGADRADLNPQTESAVRSFVKDEPPAAAFNVAAYAAGTPEDPSTARRLALSRALTVRSVLVAEGIPSVRIYVKALGAGAPGIADGPPDRVDLTVERPPASAAQPASPASTAAQGKPTP